MEISWTKLIGTEGVEYQSDIEIRETGDIYISGTTYSTHIDFVDDGDAQFSITGNAVIGETLSINEVTPDPDGTGTLSYSWQSSSDNRNWTEILHHLHTHLPLQKKVNIYMQLFLMLIMMGLKKSFLPQFSKQMVIKN